MNTPRTLEPNLPMDVSVAAGDPPPPRTSRPSRAGRTFVVLLAVAILLAVGGRFMFQRLFAPPPDAERTPIGAPVPGPASSEAAPAVPQIRHPLALAPDAAPLPALNDSDGPFADALAVALGHDVIARWLMPQDLIRRIVVAVDNLPREAVPQRLSPVKPVPGTFVVAGNETARVIAPANARRYVPLVSALAAVDPEKLVALYLQWYPRFQDAYREQGYPNGYFNDRLVEALDTMLAGPSAPDGIAVTQPKVLWKFADPTLEVLPAGRKIMLRIGPDNAARVKAKLVEFRRLVAREAPR